MENVVRKRKKLELNDIMLCLDILCRASAAVVKTNPQLSSEIIAATEILTMACSTESEKIEEKHDELNNSLAGLNKIKKDVITDLFSNEILYEGKT